MLRQMRTKAGRKPVSKFLKLLGKLHLVSANTAYKAILLVVFSELTNKKR
jgi:hypothetical protein